MFDTIACRYDVANRWISLGCDLRWRRRLVELAELEPGSRALDCACGTGDLALLLKQAVGSTGFVIGIDVSGEMLELARRKARLAKLELKLAVADFHRLPFDDDTFDAATIGFGVRNAADPAACLKEMARAVRPGGKVLVLESGLPANLLWRAAYKVYARYMIPLLGGVITGTPQAYKYFRDTTAEFPSGRDFIALMSNCGVFRETMMQPQLGGVAYIYRGVVS
jgi:demethylmenaquinone methyltransferase/2-methoxy-6-polyprenyl-1,4-benzoquinol methylase